MKSTAIVSAIAAAALSFGSLAQAQEHDRRGDRQHRWQQRSSTQVQVPAPVPQHTQRQTRRHDGDRDHRYSNNRNNGYTGYNAYSSYSAPRFYQGGYVPHEYRHHRYYVNDWRARHLNAPPYGYQWMQVDNGDYVLMALATGLIANLLMNQY
ncbi:MAG TPA: RcnB family protein [Ramlibacter sp.]|nr:RcnB family protein [Ramlibacter sp.]